MKKVDPMEEDLKKSVQEESDNTKHTNKQEINDNMEISETCAQACQPFFKKSNPVSSNDDDSRTSSIIPEPPSSPSLASLEEDECTPSLGLEDDDWVMIF